ncbi:MAG: PucR family transcriptional regulator [Candidatus Saccharimonadia bacterium]
MLEEKPRVYIDIATVTEIGAMLSQHVAEKIRLKVGGLVNRELSVVEPHGMVMSSNDPTIDEMVDLENTPWAISFQYGGQIVGYIVLAEAMPNHEEITPLVRSIAELVMHQSILIEQIPKQEERLDKFIYDILHRPLSEEPLLAAEGRLFDIDLATPRIAIVIYVDDPSLTTSASDPSSDREAHIARYKAGIDRGLKSFYTSSFDNIVAYIGQNKFCILKSLASNGELDDSLEAFKKSINTIYDIIKSELKVPTSVGVGNYHPDLIGLRQSYNEAISAIELGTQMWGTDRIYRIDDFGVVAPLFSGIDETNIYFSRELLDRLGENVEIIQTLEAFFTYDMSLTRTAEKLEIHRNTLVYRLDRIAETLSLDPRLFDDAVQIRLAILFTRFVEQT